MFLPCRGSSFFFLPFGLWKEMEAAKNEEVMVNEVGMDRSGGEGEESATTATTSAQVAISSFPNPQNITVLEELSSFEIRLVPLGGLGQNTQEKGKKWQELGETAEKPKPSEKGKEKETKQEEEQILRLAGFAREEPEKVMEKVTKIGALVPYEIEEVPGIGEVGPTVGNPPKDLAMVPFEGPPGVLTHPHNKGCEHGSRGRTAEDPVSSNFHRITSFLLPLNLQNMVFGTRQLLVNLSRGNRHPEALSIEEPRIPRKHQRETDEKSESACGSPPAKKTHDEENDPLEIDAPPG